MLDIDHWRRATADIEECIKQRRRGITSRIMIVDRRIFVTALVLIVASFNIESGGGSRRANDGGVSILVSAEEDIHVAQRAIHRRRRTLDEDSKNGGVDIQEQESLITARSFSLVCHVLLHTLDQSSTCSFVHATFSTPLSR